ncbi:response regulator transcription factor [Streptomyces sp. NPDC057474]|uniref:response regulator transcription factor n=1 Tax=Streptomyces sp. NPDC057474 TaxID=3346144 RepID=UPI0036C14B56
MCPYRRSERSRRAGGRTRPRTRPCANWTWPGRPSAAGRYSRRSGWPTCAPNRPGPRATLAAHPLTLLSDRERETAELATEGLRTRDIAERLLLSPRTVETLLFRVYRKLGRLVPPHPVRAPQPHRPAARSPLTLPAPPPPPVRATRRRPVPPPRSAPAPRGRTRRR